MSVTAFLLECQGYQLMGHATIEMTLRYAHLSPEARESAVQELDRPIPQPRAALG